MDSLISKLQYRNYEKGEFNHAETRTAEETILLIRDYPWNEQRQLASVELTCPSVTIEGPSGDFLKIGPFFSGKFCLYHYHEGKLSEKIVPQLEDIFEIVTNFYGHQDISEGFERSFLVFQPKKHFVTLNFEYTIGHVGALMQPFSSGVIVLPFFIFILSFSIFQKGSDRLLVIVFGLIIAMILLIGYLSMRSIRLEGKGIYLRLSRGRDDFYFGTKDGIKEYSKNDITLITKHYKYEDRRGTPQADFFEIEFNNGEKILFSSALIREGLVDKKFYSQKMIKVFGSTSIFPTPSFFK